MEPLQKEPTENPGCLGNPNIWARPNMQILQKRRSTLATLPCLSRLPCNRKPKLTESDETENLISAENETNGTIGDKGEKASYNGTKRRSSMPAIFQWEPKVRSLQTQNSFSYRFHPQRSLKRSLSRHLRRVTSKDKGLEGSVP